MLPGRNFKKGMRLMPITNTVNLEFLEYAPYLMGLFVFFSMCFFAFLRYWGLRHR